MKESDNNDQSHFFKLSLDGNLMNLVDIGSIFSNIELVYVSHIYLKIWKYLRHEEWWFEYGVYTKIATFLGWKGSNFLSKWSVSRFTTFDFLGLDRESPRTKGAKFLWKFNPVSIRLPLPKSIEQKPLKIRKSPKVCQSCFSKKAPSSDSAIYEFLFHGVTTYGIFDWQSGE